MARATKKLKACFMNLVFSRGTTNTPVREKALINVTLKKEKPQTGVGTKWSVKAKCTCYISVRK